MDTRKEIIDFVSCKENNGAILVTGAWGCGKTYLLRQIADQLNEDKTFLVVVVSLFGIETIEELDKKVKQSVFAAITPLKADSTQSRAIKKA